MIRENNMVFLILLILLISLIGSCSEKSADEPEPPCIDDSLIDSDNTCYKIFAPVCGCDGITYSNDCVAKNSGLLNFQEGACN